MHEFIRGFGIQLMADSEGNHNKMGSLCAVLRYVLSCIGNLALHKIQQTSCSSSRHSANRVTGDHCHDYYLELTL